MSGVDPPSYVVTAADGGDRAGCLVGFATQCSIDPPRFGVWLSKLNRTYRVAQTSRTLVVHLLRDGDGDLAERFGGETGDEVDKFAGIDWSPGPDGCPVIERLDWFAGSIVDRLDTGDHVAFVLAPRRRSLPALGPAALGVRARRHRGRPSDPRPLRRRRPPRHARGPAARPVRRPVDRAARRRPRRRRHRVPGDLDLRPRRRTGLRRRPRARVLDDAERARRRRAGRRAGSHGAERRQPPPWRPRGDGGDAAGGLRGTPPARSRCWAPAGIAATPASRRRSGDRCSAPPSGASRSSSASRSCVGCGTHRGSCTRSRTAGRDRRLRSEDGRARRACRRRHQRAGDPSAPARPGARPRAERAAIPIASSSPCSATSTSGGCRLTIPDVGSLDDAGCRPPHPRHAAPLDRRRIAAAGPLPPRIGSASRGDLQGVHVRGGAPAAERPARTQVRTPPRALLPRCGAHRRTGRRPRRLGS